MSSDVRNGTAWVEVTGEALSDFIKHLPEGYSIVGSMDGDIDQRIIRLIIKGPSLPDGEQVSAVVVQSVVYDMVFKPVFEPAKKTKPD